MKNKPYFHAIGLMSGTSMDGIDAALICTDGYTHSKLIARAHFPYSNACYAVLKACAQLAQITTGNMRLLSHQLGSYLQQHLDAAIQNQVRQELGVDVKALALEDIIDLSTEFHIKATKSLLDKNQDYKVGIDAIGFHGQTIYHDASQGLSVQLGDARKMHHAFAVPVVYDFRAKDMRAGGQGAPLAPVFHAALVTHANLAPAVVVNCGGVANVSIVAGIDEDIYGFDTGPGNAMLDTFVYRRTEGKFTCDFNGTFGLQGTVDPHALAALKEQAITREGKNFLHLPPPKSLDANEFQFPDYFNSISLENGCASLAQFTVECIVDGVANFNPNYVPQCWVLVGGGWENPVLTSCFKRYVKHQYPQSNVMLAGDCHWDNESLEAQLMAYCAIRRLLGLPISYPTTTGANEPLCGGSIYPPTRSQNGTDGDPFPMLPT